MTVCRAVVDIVGQHQRFRVFNRFTVSVNAEGIQDLLLRLSFRAFRKQRKCHIHIGRRSDRIILRRIADHLTDHFPVELLIDPEKFLPALDPCHHVFVYLLIQFFISAVIK